MSLVKDIHPELRREWHPSLNVGISFDELRAKSTAKTWWLCSKNAKHVWQTRVRNRAIEGYGCPYCSGLKVLREESFAAISPKLAAELHPTKNGTFDPWSVGPGSNKKVWWQCPTPFKHEWQTTISTRVTNGSGCKQCNRIRNPLSKKAPLVAKEWHPTKNIPLTPDSVPAGSRKKVWWQCAQEPTHQWQAGIYGRVKARTLCPFCAKQRGALPPTTLNIAFPKLAKQWHPTKNLPLKPSDVYPSSDKKVWWVCPVDTSHVWQASLRNRAKLNHGCRFCARSTRYVTPGHSLADLFPHIASEWHPVKNALCKPSEVSPGSSKRIWWRCTKDPAHEWQATVTTRTQKKPAGKCPHCSGRVVNSANSLQAIHPEISKEWHPTKNAPVTPDAIKRASGKKVWWQCPVNPAHEWVARVKNRTILGSGCPFCALYKSSESNTNFLETFQNDMRTLRALSKQQAQKTDRLTQAFYRMLYSSAITVMETFLSDAFYQTVINDDLLIERLMLTTPEFKDRKYSLSEVVEWQKTTKAKVADYLLNIVWHNLGKIRCMYDDTLGVKFPAHLAPVHTAVAIRHDIVHRNGKTTKGIKHRVTQGDVEKVFVAIENFVMAINSQLDARKPKAPVATCSTKRS